jgi:hypothetical protein
MTERCHSGAGLFLTGVAAVVIQVGLVFSHELGDPAAFFAGLVGALACYFGGIGALRGTPRRFVAAGALVWVVGWIAVAPASTAGGQARLYGVALVVGCLLCGTAGMVGRSPGGGPRAGTAVVPGQLTGWHWLLAGGALAVPSAIGLLVGAEAVALTFVILAAVAVILLYLFRPTG